MVSPGLPINLTVSLDSPHLLVPVGKRESLYLMSPKHLEDSTRPVFQFLKPQVISTTDCSFMGKISGWEQLGWRAAWGNMGFRRNPTLPLAWSPSLLQGGGGACWHITVPREPVRLGWEQHLPVWRLGVNTCKCSMSVGKPCEHLDL